MSLRVVVESDVFVVQKLPHVLTEKRLKIRKIIVNGDAGKVSDRGLKPREKREG